MGNTDNTQDQVVPSVEIALDALCTWKTKPNEKLYKFVARCVQVVAGTKQRKQLYRAILDTANELGLKATDPASYFQLSMQQVDEEAKKAGVA